MPRAALVFATVAALASTGAAQARDTTRADSARKDSARVTHLAPVVVSTRLTDADESVPAQVDKVNVRDLAPGAAGAAAALARLPGVSAYDDQGSPAQPTLEIRGFNLSPVVGVPQGVSVFLDGVRVNEPDAQEVNFDLLPMDAVARGQLVRGPATLYGKNTLAGALVLFTQRGETVPVLEGEVSGGSFGLFNATVNAGGKSGAFDGFLSVNFLNEAGWRDDGGLTERSVFLNLGRKRDSSDMALTVMYAHDSIAEPGSLPASWLAVNPRLNYTAGDFFAPDLWHFALRGERAFGGGVLRGALFYRHNASEQFNVNVDAPSSDAFLINQSYGLTTEWSAPLTAWSRPLAFTAGIELARNDVTERIYARLTADTSVHLPPDCTPSTGLCANVHVPEQDAGVFAQGVLNVTPDLAITAAARFDWVRVPFEDLYDTTNSATGVFTHLSPRLGATYTFDPAWRGYAVVSGGFRAPAPVELGCASPDAPCPLPYALGSDPALEPVSLASYEMGADWSPRGGSTLEASLFWSDVHDEIVFVASSNSLGYFRNIPHTRRAGIEVSGVLLLPHGMRATASYTYLNATYRSTVLLSSQLPVPDSVRPGDAFPLSPHDRVTFTFGAVEPVGAGTIDAEVGMNAVSTQFVRGDDANVEAPLPGYAVWRLRATYAREHIAFTATVQNLFDHQFSSFATYADNPVGPPGGPPSDEVERFYTPAQPRAFILSMKLTR